MMLPLIVILAVKLRHRNEELDDYYDQEYDENPRAGRGSRQRIIMSDAMTMITKRIMTSLTMMTMITKRIMTSLTHDDYDYEEDYDESDDDDYDYEEDYDESEEDDYAYEDAYDESEDDYDDDYDYEEDYESEDAYDDLLDYYDDDDDYELERRFWTRMKDFSIREAVKKRNRFNLTSSVERKVSMKGEYES